MIYFDTSYLVRLYFEDRGFEAVRQLAVAESITCCLIGKAEVLAAFHRKRREGRLTAADHRTLSEEFIRDSDAGAFHWRPLSDAVIERVRQTYTQLPADVFLRAADAMHLACAAEHQLTHVYSNDAHLLAAAPHFGLRGVNVI